VQDTILVIIDGIEHSTSNAICEKIICRKFSAITLNKSRETHQIHIDFFMLWFDLAERE
jgi:hypothetical protein